MKQHKMPLKAMLALLIFSLFFNALKAQDPVWISNTDLKSVKIYMNGALVSRSARTTLSPGLQQVVFDGLSPYINPQSITLKGTGEASILNVSFQTDYLTEQHKTKEVESLEALRDSLQYKSNQLVNRQATINELQAALQANKSIGGANNGVMADELELFMDYYNKKSNALKDEWLDVGEKNKKLVDRITKINAQLNQLQQRNGQPSGNIVVNVDVKTKGICSFDLSYLISSNVSWTMAYEMRVKDVSSPVELVHKARVNQQSGEDWKQANLTLSTGNPLLGSEKPQLNPWTLQFFNPTMYRTEGMKDAHYAPMVMAGAVMKEADAPNMQSIVVQLNQQQMNNEYAIQQPYTIKSDGQDYYVEIQKQTMPAVYRYVVVPKIDLTAYLTARVANFSDLSLIPGEATIYFDGTLVGNTYLNPVETSDTLLLSLGRDERISIKRETMKDYSGNKLFGGNRERSFSYDISVKNNKKTAIDLDIEDQLPISGDKEIEVKDAKYPGATLDPETGLLTWRLTLAPGASDKKQLSYTIRYPKDKRIAGW